MRNMLGQIRKIANKISKDFSVPNPVITRVADWKIELRTELPSYDGGWVLQTELEAQFPGWICENAGGCVYYLYKPW